MLRILRSRRLASWLIVIVSAYSIVSTLVPLGSPDDPAVIEWAAEHPVAEGLARLLGLHHAFTTPLFLLLAALLTLSTAACAWERSREAILEWGDRWRVSAALAGRVASRPDISVDIPTSAGDPLELAAEAMHDVGMRTHHGSTMVEGRMNAIGLAGSPVFHWLLVALFLIVGVGLLTRAEGSLFIVTGQSRADVREQYARGLSEGPLFGDRFSRLDIQVAGFDPDLEVDGVSRGDASRLVVRRGEQVVVDQWVYPNNPVRIGSLTVHQLDAGPAAVITLWDPSAETTTALPLFFHLDEAAPQGIGSLEIPITGVEDVDCVRMEPLEGQRLAVAVVGPDDRELWRDTVSQGETIELSTGERMRLDALTTYSELALVNDWSIPYIYMVLGLLSVATIPSFFAPPRTAWALVVNAGDDRRLHVQVRARRADPMFRGKLERAIQTRVAELED